ncbi:2,3-diaminopropionate biosynthesis protein SbnB [Paenibacillus arenosi]|uniref:2,3-diaminopropionate biosynthesis protein SbnB n=1 Tax=Paenibacillus arenosi TaxID=2774142 RepID=A0ABR9AS44_9BACL|nr:2,3-diaminopropionate biosynthesis protein SbnB [Paenibacillus arenosi]MBD8496921.1 2,3-diaminopropionate biosynthesis protein SbnB [Paenibacillus arenosi]
MLYLNEEHVLSIGVNWAETTEVIENTIKADDVNQVVQPVKPYLRFKDKANRIIAMPAYVGDEYDVAGIKWIASFPDNINKGIPRASSVVILNDANTGQVKSIINGALLSIIRTASVSGLLIQRALEAKKLERFSIGIIGWGPIGQNHYHMCRYLFEDQIEQIYLYDINGINGPESVVNDSKVRVCSDWREVYHHADVFMTCTVSKERYIDEQPKPGAILLNVSLRDYKLESYDYVKNGLIVDHWKEVCRENTDIEWFYLQRGLQEQDVKTFADVICRQVLHDLAPDQPIMFNPMGMAAFDISIGEYYLRKARELNMGQAL